VTTGPTRKRALEVAENATTAAGQIRLQLARDDARYATRKRAGGCRRDGRLAGCARDRTCRRRSDVDLRLPATRRANTFIRVAQNTMIQSGGGWWFIGLAVATAVAAYYAYQRRGGGAGTLVFGLIAIAVAVYYGTNKGSLTLCPVDQSSASTLGIGCSKAHPGGRDLRGRRRRIACRNRRMADLEIGRHRRGRRRRDGATSGRAARPPLGRRLDARPTAHGAAGLGSERDDDAKEQDVSASP
jgi:hypothetical protein